MCVFNIEDLSFAQLLDEFSFLNFSKLVLVLIKGLLTAFVGEQNISKLKSVGILEVGL